MKYLKLFEAKKKVPDQSKEIFSERIKTTEKDIPEFVEKISDMIEINWEIYDFDENLMSVTTKQLLKKIPYIELYSPEEAYTKTELLVINVLNIGVSVANDMHLSSSKNVFRYDDLLKGMEKILHFDRIDRKKLVYNGPDITSSSILSSTFNIKYQMKNIEETIEKNYLKYDDNDEATEDELAELKIIIGCVYQFGYGIGADRKRRSNEESREKLSRIMSKKDRTPEEEEEFRLAFRKFMDDLK